MREGMFTGKKLADFNFPQDLDNPPRTNPRRIVNGADGSDDKVRTHHMVFAAALEAAGWQQESAATPVPRGFWDYIFAAFARFFTPKGN